MFTLAGAALTAGAAVGGSILASKAEQAAAASQSEDSQQLYEFGATQREKYSQIAQAEAAAAKRNLNSSEQARLSLMSSLGQAGTYDAAINTSGPLSLGVLRPSGISGASPLTANTTYASGVVKGSSQALNQKAEYTGKQPWEVASTSLDPEALADQIRGTAGFRTVSRMVAEAEQLQNRTGPLWEQLNNSVVGGIYEGAAAQNRQAMEAISREMARGGTARRGAVALANKMMAQEQINRDRSGQLWQAKMQLEEFRTKYAPAALDYAEAWVGNQAGIRDSFTSALNNLETFWTTAMAPALISGAVNAAHTLQGGANQAAEGQMMAAQTRSQGVSGAIDGLSGALTGTVIPWAQDKYTTYKVGKTLDNLMASGDLF